jgi:hypothetical protein
MAKAEKVARWGDRSHRTAGGEWEIGWPKSYRYLGGGSCWVCQQRQKFKDVSVTGVRGCVVRL